MYPHHASGIAVSMQHPSHLVRARHTTNMIHGDLQVLLISHLSHSGANRTTISVTGKPISLTLPQLNPLPHCLLNPASVLRSEPPSSDSVFQGFLNLLRDRDFRTGSLDIFGWASRLGRTSSSRVYSEELR
jgi:hypothetical protein